MGNDKTDVELILLQKEYKGNLKACSKIAVIRKGP